MSRARSAMSGRSARPTGGFTLLEVILAAGLFAIGMSVILNVFSFGAAMTRSAESRSLSADAIDSIVMNLEDTLFPLLSNGVPGPPREVKDEPLPGYPNITYSATATPNWTTMESVAGTEESALPREYRVTIDARWSARGVKRSAQWTTILLREQRLGARLRNQLFSTE